MSIRPEDRELLWVRDAKIAEGVAQADLVRAIAKARRRGYSLRAIADAAGMSHEQVRRLAPSGGS